MRARVIACASLLALAAPAEAQEFAAPDPAGEPGAAALLERGLAAPRPSLAVSALAVRWDGLSELATRSVAVGAGWRAARAALGVSQTGDAELGWSALAIAGGAAGPWGGAALRGSVRRSEGGAVETVLGGEVGAGAWVVAAPGAVVWASAPQLWTRGDPPPLARFLEIGARVEMAGARAWLARSAAPGAPGGVRGEHLAGLALPLGPARLWVEGRDHQPRATVGLGARAGRLRAGIAIDGHPVLGETVRLGMSLGEEPW